MVECRARLRNPNGALQDLSHAQPTKAHHISFGRNAPRTVTSMVILGENGRQRRTHGASLILFRALTLHEEGHIVKINNATVIQVGNGQLLHPERFELVDRERTRRRRPASRRRSTAR